MGYGINMFEIKAQLGAPWAIRRAVACCYLLL